VDQVEKNQPKDSHEKHLATKHSMFIRKFGLQTKEQTNIRTVMNPKHRLVLLGFV